MNNLQLATTLVAPTGTGLLYIPQGGDPQDVASYVNGSGSTRSSIILRRTQPKPTSVFPGVTRMELKRQSFYTVNAVEYTCVTSLVTSIPVPIALADRTALFTQLALLARDPMWQTALESNVIPT